IAGAVTSAWQAAVDEVIVADGGSTDPTRDLAVDGGARTIVSEPGRARQQNAGARVARGDVLLFLHADNRLVPGCGDQVRRAFVRPQIMAAAFRQRIAAVGWGFRMLEWGNALRVCWLGTPYGDQGLCLRREVFERVGGFPEVELLEDLLIMRTVRRVGWPVLLPGPLHVSARRWQRHGVVWQTIRNWWLVAAFQCGRTPAELARHYRRHDDGTTC
ncbi:MAG: TIGR04283 family arsenosugar biosynthesis glycosyltransferase, partial [Pirellulaceae bacterium]